MKIKKLSATRTATTDFDLNAFSAELRELSAQYRVKLVSVGAMSGLDAGGSGTTYLAIWSSGKNN